jgi:hypothetical protein
VNPRDVAMVTVSIAHLLLASGFNQRDFDQRD